MISHSAVAWHTLTYNFTCSIASVYGEMHSMNMIQHTNSHSKIYYIHRRKNWTQKNSFTDLSKVTSFESKYNNCNSEWANESNWIFGEAYEICRCLLYQRPWWYAYLQEWWICKRSSSNFSPGMGRYNGHAKRASKTSPHILSLRWQHSNDILDYMLWFGVAIIDIALTAHWGKNA